MTDGAGVPVATRQYDAWGNPEIGAGEPGYAYTGREWDPETGLYYYRARYYDPKIGRFLSEDPIGFDGGVNFHAYVSNNPVNFVDPLGLAEIISIHHYSLSTATATRIADRIIADLKRGGIEASYKLTSKPSGVAGMLIPQALVPGSSFLLELRDSRAGRPRIRSSECGHMFAQILKDHAGVATDVIKERALALGEAGWEERFEIGVANVATHEIGHAFSRHSDSHSLMKHGGAERDEWLFDPTLPWR